MLDRQARLSVVDVPLPAALLALSQHSRVSVAFSPNFIPQRHRVSCDCEHVTVGQALHTLLSGTDFVFTVYDDQILVVPRRMPSASPDVQLSYQRPIHLAAVEAGNLVQPLSSAPVRLVPPQQDVTGVVVDAATNRPLIGVQILIEETGQGAITDTNGRFLIPGVTGEQVTLRVVLLGYREWSESVSPGDPALRIELEQRALELQQIVVTGTPGEQQVRSLGNAIAVINAAELETKAPSQNVVSQLAARVPGVRILKAGGEVTAGANIRIRGTSSMVLPGEPLIYIDGIRVNNRHDDSGGVGSNSSNHPSRLNDLTPEDIESYEVIKGPAAATLYGTEAANGVIQIITKKGREGAPVFNVHLKQGASWLPNPEEFFTPAYYKSSTGEIVEVNVLREDRLRGLGPWFRTGQPRAFGANVSGGTQTFRYYFSGDWDRDEGVVSYNWQEKLSGRANMGYTPDERLSVDLSIGTMKSDAQFASTMQPFTMAILWACPAPGCEPGSNAPNALDGPWRGYNLYLPERYEDDVEGKETVHRTTLSLQTTHRPTDWFTHRLKVGNDYGSALSSDLYRLIDDETLGMFIRDGRKRVSNRTFGFQTIDYVATATHRLFERLGLNTSAGIQYYRRHTTSARSDGQTFAVRSLETVSAGATQNASENFEENKTIGVFLQEQLSWQDRLFLTAAVRGDDNSAFGADYEFVVYPKFQASWIVSDEPFLQGASLLSQLKLRAAWGTAGQQPDVFAALRTYEPVPGPGGAPTLTPQAVGNPELAPEVGEEVEVGLDAALFDDRLGLEFTYYRQRTTDAIVPVPSLPSLGFPGIQFRNIGEIRNSGIELGIRGNLYQGGNLGVEAGLNLSTNHSRIMDVGGGPPIIFSAFSRQYHVPGFPIASIFQKRVVSADLDHSGPQTVAVDVMCEGGERIPGTNLSRGGGSPVPCDDAPQVFWGQPLPTWEGSFNATINLFRKLQIFSVVDFMGGHTLINGDMHFGHHLFGNTRAIYERTDPILLGYEAIEGSSAQQSGILDGSWAKLRTVSATYTLPSNWTERFGASRASITLSGDNLGVLWWGQREAFGLWQLDPETRSTGGTALSAFNQEGWPQFRRFTAALRASF